MFTVATHPHIRLEKSMDDQFESRRFTRAELRTIAASQKAILLCILVYFGMVVAQFLIPQELRIFLGLGLLALGVIASVFMFILAIKLYDVGLGVVAGICTLIPCIGLITLLIVNQKATSVLRYYGYSVGLLGVPLSQFDEREPRGGQDRRPRHRDERRSRRRSDNDADRDDRE
jgi:hypothetical protein